MKKRFFLNLEKYHEKMNIKSHYKLIDTLYQIDKLELNDYRELVSYAIRPILEIIINLFYDQIKKRFDNDFYKNKKENEIKIPYKTRYIYEYFKKDKNKINKTNKISFFDFENDFLKENGIFKILNWKLHDSKYKIFLKDIENMLEKTSIFLEEIWKNID